MTFKRKQSGFTLTEILIGLGLILIVGGFAVFAGIRFMKRNADVKFEAKQWEAVQTFRKRVTGLLESSVYVSTRETDNQLFGISNTSGANSSDMLQLYAFPEDSTGTSYSVVSQFGCSNGLCSSLRLQDKNNPNPALPYFNVNQFIYLASPEATYLVQVVGGGGNSKTDVKVMPSLPQFGAGIKPIAARVDVQTIYLKPNGRAADLVKANATIAQVNAQSSFPAEILIPSVDSFQVLYSLKQKRTQNRQDSCACSNEIQNFRWKNGWLNPEGTAADACNACNFNNLMRVTFDLKYFVRDDLLPEHTKSEAFTSAPTRFDPQNWGNFSSLNLSGPTTAAGECDDHFENRRCKPQCTAEYMKHNFQFAGGMKSSDFVEGSDYCNCQGKGFNLAEITRDDSRYGACCKYRDTLTSRAGADPKNTSSNPNRSNVAAQCSFTWCTAPSRTDNPWLGLCNADTVCGGVSLGRTCIYQTMRPDLCNPDGGKGGTSGSTSDFYPPNPNLVTLTQVSDSSHPLPITDGNGKFISGQTDLKGNSLDGKILSKTDSNACECERQLYPDGVTRTIAVPSSYATAFPSTTDTNSTAWSGSFSIPGHPARWSPGGGSPNANELFLYQPDPYSVSKPDGWRVCWDQVWDNPKTSTGSTNRCQFQADSSSGENIISPSSPLDPGYSWSGGGGMPGQRTGAGISANQIFMNRCAAERAGLPHDLNVKLDFNGFDAKKSPTFTTDVPGGRPSCISPERAAASQVNVDYFSKLPSPINDYSGRLAQIQSDCSGTSGGGGPTPGSGGL
ncbi:MAG: prepilin-type N-terminal cleavage/methylation domain-containing protein [Deltaproteobacteria bacterium]|nr:prepilin-type N-terminal cleavage/methylation domain-containing protein [Deltaproteobacteria bacterium]